MKTSTIRKFKFGSVWTLITVAVIASIIALNAVFTALSSKYALTLDLTKAQYYEVSDASMELLGDFKDEVNILFCTPLDKLSDNQHSAMIYNLAKNYAAKFDNINIEYFDWRTETIRANEYMKRMANATIDDTTIIVENPEKGARKLTWDSMLQYDNDGILYGFRGELQFTSAILQTTGERPIVSFITNHSEDIMGAGALMSLFDTAGYDVRKLSLSTDNIPEGTRILVSFNPKTDFIGDEGSNEFIKLDEYTANGGHMMFFLSPNRQELPELYSYLKEEWYVTVTHGIVKDSSEHSLSRDGVNIAATFGTEGTGASLTKHIVENNQSTPTVSVNYSLALDIDAGGDKTDGDYFASHVLTTSENGQLEKDGVVARNGTLGLMSISSRMRIIDNEQRTNHVLVSGSADFADYENLEVGVSKYANSDILYAAMLAMGKDKVPDAIDVKPFDNTSLDLTINEANNWTLVFAIAIPCILMLTGVIVYYRRKHL